MKQHKFYGLYNKTYLEEEEKAICFTTETNLKEIRKIRNEDFRDGIIVRIIAKEISPLKLQTIRSKIVY